MKKNHCPLICPAFGSPYGGAKVGIFHEKRSGVHYTISKLEHLDLSCWGKDGLTLITWRKIPALDLNTPLPTMLRSMDPELQSSGFPDFPSFRPFPLPILPSFFNLFNFFAPTSVK